MLDGSGPSCPREHLLQSRPLMTAAFHGNNGIVGKMGNEWGRQTASAVSPQLRDAFLERIRTPVNLAVLGIKQKFTCFHLDVPHWPEKNKSLGHAQGWSQFLFEKDSDHNNVYGSTEKIVYIFFSAILVQLLVVFLVAPIPKALSLLASNRNAVWACFLGEGKSQSKRRQ